MSSNDQIVILKKKGTFEVHHNLCVDNDFKSSKKSLLEEFKSLKEAVVFAKKFCNEWPYVEYGYEIHDNCLGGMK